MKKILVLAAVIGLVFSLASVKAGYAASITLENGLNSYSGTQDTYIRESSADSSYGNDTTMLVRNDTSNDRDRVSLIYFDLSPLTSLGISTIDSVSLQLYRTTGDNDNSSSYNIYAYRLTAGSWDENDVTWNHRDESTDTEWADGNDFGSSDYTSTGSASTSVGTTNQYYDWTVTNIVSNWWSNNLSNNYGFVLLSPNSTGSNHVYFYTSEYNPAASSPLLYRPKLTINYTEGDNRDPVPEPASMSLLGIGLLGAMGAGIRSRKKIK